MDLPDIMRSWAVALIEHDSQAFSKCFSEKAVVYEQHKVHAGRKAISQWMEQYSQQNHIEIRPLAFVSYGSSMVLSAELSGHIPDGRQLLKFYFIVANNLIASLKISNK